MLWSDIRLLLSLVLIGVELAVVVRALLRPMREPSSRIAWVLAIILIPIGGIIAYLLLGEARVSNSRRARFARIAARLPRPQADAATLWCTENLPHSAAFARGRAVNDLPTTTGNRAELAAGDDEAIDAMVADIDAAQSSVHLCFYIWLADGNGLKMARALQRAARRGVGVRVLADALGSRAFIHSRHWHELRQAGVDARIALPVGGLLWTLIRGRVDLRNHRKVLLVDNRIAWCGSQNLADPAFRIKARFAPWVDLMSRWEGPVVSHLQFLFASDWMAEHGDDLTAMLAQPAALPVSGQGIPAQVIGTGPTLGHAAMTECFAELIHAALAELVITTPYFVPDEQLLFALLSAARRGVRVVLVLPRRNDSWVVAGASRSSYAALLAAGVEIYEFRPGLLHAKTMVADGITGLIGSANLDRRSFDLNFENNVLFSDPALASQVRARQDRWIAASDRVSEARVAGFSLPERLWQNLMAMAGPVL